MKQIKSLKTSLWSPIVAVSLVLALGTLRAVSIPRLINYQGKLTDGLGNVVTNDTYSLRFSMFDVASGGSARWTESQVVTVNGGLFNVLLGSSQPIDSVPAGPGCYLEVRVRNDPPIAPRIRLVSAPYTYGADNSEKLGGVLASGYVRSVSATTPLVSSGGQNPTLTLSTTMGGDATGSYPNPTVGGLQGRAVAATAPTTGYVLKWNGSAWAPAPDAGGPAVVSHYDTLYRTWSNQSLTWQSFTRTAVSVQIATTGRPVQITYTGGGFHSNQGSDVYAPVEIGLFRDGNLLATNEALVGPVNGSWGVGSMAGLSFLDTTVTAATHTYEMKLIWNRNYYNIPLYQNQTALYGCNSLIAVEYR
jgi:hypothetical protein